MLLILTLLVAIGIFFLINRYFSAGISVLVIALALIAPGFIAIEPNSSRVLTLFGNYIGSIKQSGFFFVNPFYSKLNVSLRAVTREVPTIKVNDKQGNPIMIGGVVTYRVDDTFKAAFAVEDYLSHTTLQMNSHTTCQKNHSYSAWTRLPTPRSKNGLPTNSAV